MLRNQLIYHDKPSKYGVVGRFNTMTLLTKMAWYQAPSMAFCQINTPYHAIYKLCLAMHKIARHCQTQKQKSPQ